MARPSPTVLARARLARAIKAHGRDSAHPEVTEARRRYAAERAAETVRKIMAGSPPLTVAECERVTGLLRPALATEPESWAVSA